MSEPTPENFARAADMLGGMSVRHPIPYMGNVPLTIDRSVIDGVAEALDAAELRGHRRAVNETAILSIHKAVAAERAAVVAYLNTLATLYKEPIPGFILGAAQVIERGLHHPKEPANAR
jgi:hypothetical protein